MDYNLQLPQFSTSFKLNHETPPSLIKRVNLWCEEMTFLNHSCFLGHKRVLYSLLDLGAWESFLDGSAAFMVTNLGAFVLPSPPSVPPFRSVPLFLTFLCIFGNALPPFSPKRRKLGYFVSRCFEARAHPSIDWHRLYIWHNACPLFF